ncbi:crotonase/enoyl-CoA hydratase family protein [Aestuariibius sp. HNIBRBA575]|uniref:crotonase/enoyl-CoA hydratase family protein n=1 Tax=Aestuariibius sp. HNIBRBA575 TaxID=3233343 RepID=UPI0034A36935
MSRVSVEIKDHIAQVTLTRGEKMNGMDMEMSHALVAAGQDLMDRDDVRAVVLSGQGRAFCAGLDVMSFAMMAQQDPEELVMKRTHGNANLFQEISMIWSRLPMPVIVALHGVAYGAGFQLALGADIRIAAPDTKLAIMEMKWGLIPDMGGMVLLPRLTRADVVKRMTYTAEPIEAAQALDWGLITEISDDPKAAALKLAVEIAGKSPTAIRAAKRLIDVAYTGEETDVLYAESRAQSDLIGKPEMMEVIAANMAKRAPKFD